MRYLLFRCLAVAVLALSCRAQVSSITAAGEVTMVLLRNGTIRSWGSNSYGQLGYGSKTTALVSPGPALNLGVPVVQVCTGSLHSCALLANGSISCWGFNLFGQLGDNTTTDRSYPAPMFPAAADVIEITCGNYHTCMLLSNGSVQCVGANLDGELGITGPSLKVPGGIVMLAGPASTITAGYAHTCALLTNSSVQCWGGNNDGQLGVGDTNPRATPPPPLPLAGNVSAMIVGSSHTCVILANSSVQCWGINTQGQLGNGVTNPSIVPSECVPGPSLVNISANGVYGKAGYFHTILVLGNKTFQAWGGNGYGQLGYGAGSGTTTATSYLYPGPALASFGNITQVAAGYGHTCVLYDDSTVTCWGYNGDGELGSGDLVTHSFPTPRIPLCPAGSAPGQTSCSMCTPGSYSTSGLSCTLCPPGNYSTVSGATSISTCKSCNITEYCPAGSSVAALCTQGYYCPNPATILPCPAGTFGNSSGLVFNNCSGSCPWSNIPAATDCPSPSPSPTPSDTTTPSPTQSVTITATQTSTVTSTLSITPSVTTSASLSSSSTVTSTSTATDTVTPSPTRSASVTPSVTPSVTATASETQTPTASPSVTCSSSLSSTPTRTPSITPSISLTPTATDTSTPTISNTPTWSPSLSASATRTTTPSPSDSVTRSPSLTSSTSLSPTSTPSLSYSPSYSSTRTPSISTTPTASESLTSTATGSITLTPSPTISLSPTSTTTSSISISPSVTLSPSVTASPSLTSTATSTVSVSVSLSSTSSITLSVSGTPTVTPTISVTPSVTPPASVTSSISLTISDTSSRTPSISVTSSPSLTPSASPSPSPTSTWSVSLSSSASLSNTPPPSITASITLSVTPSASFGFTPSNTPTISVSPAISTTPSVTPTPTNSEHTGSVDCVVSPDWSDWSECVPVTACASDGYQYRQKAVLVASSGLGVPCPPPSQLQEMSMCTPDAPPNTCTQPCFDKVRDFGESGIDCGGTSSCSKCSAGQSCYVSVDCGSGLVCGYSGVCMEDFTATSRVYVNGSVDISGIAASTFLQPDVGALFSDTVANLMGNLLGKPVDPRYVAVTSTSESLLPIPCVLPGSTSTSVTITTSLHVEFAVDLSWLRYPASAVQSLLQTALSGPGNSLFSGLGAALQQSMSPFAPTVCSVSFITQGTGTFGVFTQPLGPTVPSHGMSGGAIAGAVIGSCIGAAIIFMVLRGRRKLAGGRITTLPLFEMSDTGKRRVRTVHGTRRQLPTPTQTDTRPQEVINPMAALTRTNFPSDTILSSDASQRDRVLFMTQHSSQKRM